VKVKQRWNQYLEVKDERDQMLQLADHADSDEEESQEGGGGGFARLSANSMIIAQRWPWTQLVELSTDRRFYHNEIENTFQFHPPKVFSEGSGQSQGQARATPNPDDPSCHLLMFKREG
jgi:hypothetical protein